jgi:hypothetical protein
MDYSDDLEVVAKHELGIEAFDRMGRNAMPEGALATFVTLDPDTRNLVLRLLDSPSEDDWAELGQRLDSEAIAKWLLTLPAFREAPESDDE